MRSSDRKCMDNGCVYPTNRSMTTISKVRAAAYCAARCRLRSTLNPERPVIYLGIFLRVGIVISDRQMRAGMRSGGQKNGTDPEKNTQLYHGPLRIQRGA